MSEPGEPPAEPTQAGGDLLTRLYEELRKLARHRMAEEPAGQTLQATALVHEAWLRLGGDCQPQWRNEAHFFAAAAQAMRRVLLDRARRRRALRRGGDAERVSLEFVELATAADDDQLLALDAALARFAEQEPDMAELVRLRFYVGLTIPEAARMRGLTATTAKRHWAYARAWLFREMQRQE